MSDDRRYTDQQEGRRAADILAYRVEVLESTVGDIRDSIKSIDTSMATLARVEVQHANIVESLTMIRTRQDKQGEAVDLLVANNAAQDAQISTQGRIVWGAVLAAIGALVTAVIRTL